VNGILPNFGSAFPRRNHRETFPSSLSFLGRLIRVSLRGRQKIIACVQPQLNLVVTTQSISVLNGDSMNIVLNPTLGIKQNA